MAGIFDDPTAFGLTPAAPPSAVAVLPPVAAPDYPGAEKKPKQAAPEKATAPAAKPAGIFDDPARFDLTPAPEKPAAPAAPSLGPLHQQPSPGLYAAEGRIGSAAAEGYRNSPPILTPEARQAVEQGGPVGRYIVSPLAQIAGGAFGAINALGAGASQAVVEGANAAGVPALGRDVNMIAQVAPVAGMGAGVPRVASVQEAPPTPRYVQEYYGEGTRQNPLAPPPPLVAPPAVGPAFVPPGAKVPVLPRILELLRADEATAATRPAEIPPNAPQPPNPMQAPAPRAVPTNPLELGSDGRPPTIPLGSDGRPLTAEGQAAAHYADAPAQPEPQSAGAAAVPANVSGLTPKQVAAYQATAEGQKLLESQQPGIADRNVYVEGVNPNLAEQEQTVNTARELKSLGMTSEEVSQEAKDIADANSTARKEHFAQIAGSDVDVANKKAELAANDEATLGAIWRNKTDAEATPMLRTAEAIKASKDGRRPLVRSVVDSVIKELYDENGQLIKDPELLQGVGDHINDLLEEQGPAPGSKKNVRAQASLLKLKQTLYDDVIEPAAPGFAQWRKDHGAAASNIQAMETLQKHENKLTGQANRMEYGRVQTMMRQIVDSRANPDKINPYKSISEDQMARLWALRDDLRRSASAQELARAPGSDSAQNFLDAVKNAAAGPVGTAAAGAIGYVAGGPLGASAVGFGKNLLNTIMSQRAVRRQTQRGMEMLHPRNALLDPNRLP